MTVLQMEHPKSSPPRLSANAPGHMTQLDGWRGIAVIGVLIQHFFPSSLKIAPAGYLGVRLFFVLSGFLITGILLRCRQISDAGQPRLTTLRQFYIRRFLRIFPVYYFCLALALAMGVKGLRESIWWHAAYLSNIYFAKLGDWGGIFFHFWSLSVEEQFYIVWPWVILLLPRRALMPTVIATILIGLAWKLYTNIADVNFFMAYCLPMGAWDALGIGALLALVQERSPRIAPEFRWLWRLLPCVGLALVAVGIILRVLEDLPATDPKLARISLSMDMGALMLSIWAIRGAALGFKGPAAAVLRWRPMLYLGLISYGLYIYHPFLIRLVEKSAYKMHVKLPEIVAFLIMTTMAIAWSAGSWHLFESPINNLKRYFPYKKKA